GWQFQEYPPTIQCLLEKALIRATKLDRKCLQLVGASRTDAGVHALGQVAHFLTPFNYDTLDRIHAEALNGLLPDDIRVREIAPVVPEFHARFSVTSKLYRYRIYNSPVMDPLLRHHAYHCPYNLNAAIMAEAAKHFVGRHDFLAFANTSRNDRVPHPVKTIIRFDVSEMGSVIQLDVEGTGFLYRQVRNMVSLPVVATFTPLVTVEISVVNAGSGRPVQPKTANGFLTESQTGRLTGSTRKIGRSVQNSTPGQTLNKKALSNFSRENKFSGNQWYFRILNSIALFVTFQSTPTPPPPTPTPPPSVDNDAASSSFSPRRRRRHLLLHSTSPLPPLIDAAASSFNRRCRLLRQPTMSPLPSSYY
ncbi:tRNA pseudouridine synthase A 1, partial [Linum perenne]